MLPYYFFAVWQMNHKIRMQSDFATPGKGKCKFFLIYKRYFAFGKRVCYERFGLAAHIKARKRRLREVFRMDGVCGSFLLPFRNA